MKSLEQWYECNALRGWNPRAQWLLGLEDSYRGNLYAALRAVYERSDGTYQGLANWSPSRTSNGCYIPAAQRQPGVQAGLIADKVDRLVQLLVGAERGMVLRLKNAAGETTTDNDALAELDDILRDELQLWHLGQLPALDLVVKGSACFGFSLPDPDGSFHGAYLGTEWCDVVFASQVKGAKARKIATDLATLPGVAEQLAQDDDGWHLVAPMDAAPLDLAFVRYQYRWDEEVAINDNGTATQTVINWLRRDYLPNAILEYQPVSLLEDELPPISFTYLPEQSEPHDWGIIPLVWMVPMGTVPGEMDGPSLLTRPVRDMATQADYAMSFMGDSHAFNSSGLLTIINARVRGRRADMQATGDPSIYDADIPTDAGGLLELEGENGANAMLLETSGRAMDTGLQLVRELDKMIQQRTGVVEPPPESAGGALSGTAMERLMQRLIGKANEYRGPYAHGIKQLVAKLLYVAERIGRVTGAGDGARAMVEWPKIVEQTADDVLAWATAFGTAAERGLLPQAEAVRQFAQKIGYDGDAEELVAQVAADEDAAVARALEMAAMREQAEPETDDDEQAEG